MISHCIVVCIQHAPFFWDAITLPSPLFHHDWIAAMLRTGRTWYYLSPDGVGTWI